MPYQWKNIGEKLKSFRKGKKLTLKMVSTETGLSISFLSDVECGRTDPSYKTIKKLAKLHGVEPSELIKDVEE